MSTPYKINQINEFQQQLKQFRPDLKSKIERQHQAKIASGEILAERIEKPLRKFVSESSGGKP